MLHKKVMLWMGLVLILLCWGFAPAAAQTNDVEDWLQQFCADAGAELSGCQHQAGQTAAVVQDIAQELLVTAQACAAEVEAGNVTPAQCGQMVAIYSVWLVEMACYEGEQANGPIPACQTREAIQARFQNSNAYETLTDTLDYCQTLASQGTTGVQDCLVGAMLFSAYGVASVVCGLADETQPLPACENVSDLLIAIGDSNLPDQYSQCQALIEQGYATEEQCRAILMTSASIEMYTYCGITSDDPVRNSPGCQALALHQEGDGLVSATAQTCSEMVASGEMTNTECAQLVTDSGSDVLASYCTSDAAGTDEDSTRLCAALAFSSQSSVAENAALCARAAQNDWVSPRTCAVLVTQQVHAELTTYCGDNSQDPLCANLSQTVSQIQSFVQLDGDIAITAAYCHANAEYTPQDCAKMVALVASFQAAQTCTTDDRATPFCDNVLDHLNATDGDVAATVAFCQQAVQDDPAAAPQCAVILTQVLIIESLNYCGVYAEGGMNNAPGCEALGNLQDSPPDGDLAKLTALCAIGTATGAMEQQSCEYLMTEAVTATVSDYCAESPQHQAVCDQVGSGDDLQRVISGCASGEITGDQCSALNKITDQAAQQRDVQAGDGSNTPPPPPAGGGDGGILPTPQPDAPRPTLQPPANGGGNVQPPQPPADGGGGNVQPPPPPDGGDGGNVQPPPPPDGGGGNVQPPPPPDGGGGDGGNVQPPPPPGGGGGRGG